MTKIDLAVVPIQTGSNYPPPLDAPCRDQSTQRLARHAGLTLCGVNLTVIPPGGWSSQRHWHSHEDELVWVVEGELTLVTSSGEVALRAGDCAAFRRNDPDGHHLINRSDRPARILEIGNSSPEDRCVYPDVDMVGGPGDLEYRHFDGTSYPRQR